MNKTAAAARKIDWKAKLTSRKLWCAIAAGVVMALTVLFGDGLTPEAVDIIKSGVGVLIAYIFGESAVDVARQMVEKIRAEMLGGQQTGESVVTEDTGSDAD